MEFMGEFPDDGACLHYLWTTRYAPDGEHAFCPQNARRFKRYGGSALGTSVGFSAFMPSAVMEWPSAGRFLFRFFSCFRSSLAASGGICRG